VLLFDANKNCLPKDKLWRNASFPVCPDSCAAACITKVTVLEILLCFFHQNTGIQNYAKKIKCFKNGHEILIIKYPKYFDKSLEKIWGMPV